MTVRTIDFAQPEQARDWDEYVRAHPDAHPTDLSGWRLLYRELYGLRDASFAAMDGSRICGIASAYLIPSPFFGRMLVTSPYFGYGGLHTDSPETAAPLVEAMERRGSELKVDFLEWRRTDALPEPYTPHQDFREFRLPLDDDPETTFTKRLKSNARQNVRKSRSQGLSFSVTSDPNGAWKLISQTIRDLGTPYHKRRFFELLVKYFPDEIRFSEVHHQDRLVAAGVLLRFRDMLLTPYIGSLRESRSTRANYFQYWGIVEHCIVEGLSRFELGRSPIGSTHEKFKLKWGAEPLPVTYSVRTMGSRPYRNVTAASRLERTATEIWKYLPLPLTRRVGHLVFRHLP